MDLADGGIDEDVFEVRAIRQSLEKAFPDPCQRPSAKPGVDTGPFAEAGRQVAPGRRAARLPERRLEEQSGVGAAASGQAFAAGKEMSDTAPCASVRVRLPKIASVFDLEPESNQN